MQQENIAQLDEAVSEVFALMLDRECKPGRCAAPPLLQSIGQPQANTQPAPAICALIRFSGTLRGACSIHLAHSTAAILTAELIGSPADDPEDTLTEDTAGELCNMIAGSWKSRQPEAHASCHLSSPHLSKTHLPGLTLADTPTTSDSPFRYSLTRIYRFEDHCFRLELGFD